MTTATETKRRGLVVRLTHEDYHAFALEAKATGKSLQSLAVERLLGINNQEEEDANRLLQEAAENPS
jgi:hypothetical protein